MPKKILVADSSITIQKVFSFTFKGPDYSITAVGDAATALAKAKEIAPDLIVVDLSLPQKNGYEFFQEIRRNPQLQKAVGLILVSANETFAPEKGRPVGVSDFLVKPFDTQTLTNKVRELLSRPPKAVEPVPSAKDLPPLSMQDEPSLIRFTRSTLTEKPQAPAPAMSDDVQAVDQDLQPETEEFAEVETLEPEAELEPVAELEPAEELEPEVELEPVTELEPLEELEPEADLEPAAELEPLAESEPELVSLDQVDLEPAELGEEKMADPAAEDELDEIVLEEEVAQEAEPESGELEPMELEPIEMEPLEPAQEAGAEDIEFDVLEDGAASHFEAKPKKPAAPAAPDLSALDDLPLAEAEEIEELPEMEETPPMEELAPDSTPGMMEEVPPEIPYAEAVEEELGLGDETPAGGAEPLELEPEPELDETRIQELVEETPLPVAEEEVLELETGSISEERPAAAMGTEAGLEALAMESEQEKGDLSGAIPTDLEDQMPEEEFIAVDDAEVRKSAPAPRMAMPPAPAASKEEMNRLAAETFEKVAWEVIPDLVDQLVREMVKESLEKVAWEVVPDLAARLIQEEIKRLEAQAGK